MNVLNVDKLNYFIRLDGIDVNDEDIEDFVSIIKQGLPSNFKVRTFSILNYQQKSKLPSISLDKFFAGNHHLKVSRVFKHGDTSKPLYMAGSPEDVSLDEQVKTIPQGEYVLIDDDSVSGYTINWMKEYFKKFDIQIQETEFILKSLDDYMDVIDIKDFVIGTKGAGLVQLFPDGSIGRVPYLHPFINLTERASILPECADVVSKELWSFNKRYYKRHKKVFKFAELESIENKNKLSAYLNIMRKEKLVS